MYLLPLSQSHTTRPRDQPFSVSVSTWKPQWIWWFKISSIDSRGEKKTCRKQCGGQAKKGREKILETPRNCVIPNILSMNFSDSICMFCVSSKLRCRCYIFFLYSRFLTLGKTLIRMPEFGILLHIYIDSEALFLRTFLCTKASRQFSLPSPWAFRCCKVSPTLPSGKCKFTKDTIQGKEKCTYGCFQK